MAKPQIAHGYTRIAHELLEAIINKVTDINHLRIMLLIIRLTYGFHKKITITYYKSLTSKLNYTEAEIKTLLTQMEFLGLIVYTYDKDSKQCVVGIEKDYDQWTI